MQRSIAIALLVSLSIQSIALLALLGWVRMTATSEAKRYIRYSAPRNECTRIIVAKNTKASTSSSIQWLDEHEFSLDGVMYDVVSRNDSADVIVILALPDTKETWARNHLEPHIHEQIQHKTHGTSLALHLLELQYLTGELPTRMDVPELCIVNVLQGSRTVPTLPGFDTLLEVPPNWA